MFHIVQILNLFLFSISLLFHLSEVFQDEEGFLRYIGIIIFPAFYPLILLITMFIVNIFEGLNNLRYERKTKKRLKDDNLLKIAITGSYGKTSIKNLVYDVLSMKYLCLKTKGSYNNQMGITKTILEEMKLLKH